MLRRDYVKLAAALAVSNPAAGIIVVRSLSEYALIVWRQTVLNVAAVLQADNPRFNREQFLKAVGF